MTYGTHVLFLLSSVYKVLLPFSTKYFILLSTESAVSVNQRKIKLSFFPLFGVKHFTLMQYL